MPAWMSVCRQLDGLNESLAHLQGRVRKAVAGEISRLVSQTVHDLLQLILERPQAQDAWTSEDRETWADEEYRSASSVEERPVVAALPRGTRLRHAACRVMKSYAPTRPLWCSVVLAIGATLTTLSTNPVWQGVNSLLLHLSDIYPTL